MAAEKAGRAAASDFSEAPTGEHPRVVASGQRRVFGPLSGPAWSNEDRYLKLVLKIGLVLTVLALDVILVGAVAFVMWDTVR